MDKEIQKKSECALAFEPGTAIRLKAHSLN